MMSIQYFVLAAAAVVSWVGAGVGVVADWLPGRFEADEPVDHLVEQRVTPTPPPPSDAEMEAARALETRLRREGFTLAMRDKVFQIKPFTVRRLLQVGEQAIVSFDGPQFEQYLATTIAPRVHIEPQEPRFAFTAEGKIMVIGQPSLGQRVDATTTVKNVDQALAAGQTSAALAVVESKPTIGSDVDVNTLGITSLLTSGETDFRGSPKNRVHNITVGTARYHGWLIPPSAEFSFDQVLGPVDAAHGFKPELVIKHNVTTPEFGGGLCQVSTTAFRAAVSAGLKITARRNHAYAVRYYGKPGFDATIYPPYTDLRFLNNTPGYILIQTKIEGTKLSFEFWGTPDGRQVAVEGPFVYARQSNGAVKATLKQKVTKGGEILFEDTFYSNYKSPALFPHALHDQPPITAPTSPEASRGAAPSASPTPQPRTSSKPRSSPISEIESPA